MHIFLVSFFTAGVLYALFEQQSLIVYFLLPIGIYLLISHFLPGAKTLSTRQKIMVGTWGEPTEGNIHVKISPRVQNCLKVIQKNNSQEKITMTHFAIKACGQLMKEASSMNSKLIFGKRVPLDSINISCLVDIDGGKDLAMLLIPDVDKKSIPEIAGFIREKALKIKKNKGDADHKKRTGSANFLPTFMISILTQIASFVNYRLGLDIPALAIKKNQFGIGCVTSLGMLNFTDAIAPFSGFMNCIFMLSVNAIQEAPVVKQGKLEVGKIMHCNFTVDHRYVDGGRAKKFSEAFLKVFQEPEKYLASKSQQNIKKDA